MILFEFLERVKPLGIFSIGVLELLYPGLDKRRLYEWQLKNYIIKLRNGWYCLPDFIKENYSSWIIANAVHEPSYVSMESALSYHGLIPEGVYMTTSLTTNRTIRLSMAGSSYVYSSVRNELFFGYKLIDTNYHHRMVRVAEPEKALIDLLQFHRTRYSTDLVLEKLNAFKDDIDQQTLTAYALKANLTTQRILGFLMDCARLDSSQLHLIVEEKSSVSAISNSANNLYNHKWKLYHDPHFSKYIQS